MPDEAQKIRRLRHAVKLRDMRHREIAALCGVSRQAVSQWLMRKFPVPSHHYVTLARELELGTEDMTRGERLRYARLDAMLSQAEVGHLISVTAAVLGRMEMGTHPITDAEWATLADVLDVGEVASPEAPAPCAMASTLATERAESRKRLKLYKEADPARYRAIVSAQRSPESRVLTHMRSA